MTNLLVVIDLLYCAEKQIVMDLKDRSTHKYGAALRINQRGSSDVIFSSIKEPFKRGTLQAGLGPIIGRFEVRGWSLRPTVRICDGQQKKLITLKRKNTGPSTFYTGTIRNRADGKLYKISFNGHWKAKLGKLYLGESPEEGRLLASISSDLISAKQKQDYQVLIEENVDVGLVCLMLLAIDECETCNFRFGFGFAK